MLDASPMTSDQSLRFDDAEIQISARLENQALTIDIMKSGACVHRVTLEDARTRLDNLWLADLFARESKVVLGTMKGEMNEYLEGLDVNQG
ncbi:MAG TPA: hypothetical protein PK970_05415 [Hyphomicrobiaceae bacterium]|nr:hypothetical protein [Hyphomicrobiaceae bacterium]